MIISHKHKFIFLKTRKTAGTSIEIALSRFCGDEDIITPIDSVDERLREELSYRGPQNFRHTPEDGQTPRGERQIDYYNHMQAKGARTLIGAEVWDKYFKFCFERNPWDRAISMHFRRTHGLQPRPTLLEFLRHENEKHLSRDKRSRLPNFRIYSIGGDVVVDHVGLYEDLDSELERIATLLDLPGEIELPKAKASARKDRRPYREVMGREERDIVAGICAREIKHFGYVF